MAPRLRTAYTPWLPPPTTSQPTDEAPVVDTDHTDAGPADQGEAEDELDQLLDKYSNEAQAELDALKQAGRKAPSQRSSKALREEALNTPLSQDNKGFQLLQKMGYQQGGSLGRSVRGRAEPIPLDIRGNRSGLGVHEQKKRALEHQQQHATHQAEKRARQLVQQQAHYKQAAAGSFSSRRLRRQLAAARTACETLDAQAGTEATSVLLQLYPPQSDEALEGDEAKAKTDVDDAEEEEGDESLSREEKLQTVLGYMRGLHRYCFFCGCQYNSAEDMAENCPGLTEEDH